MAKRGRPRKKTAEEIAAEEKAIIHRVMCEEIYSSVQMIRAFAGMGSKACKRLLIEKNIKTSWRKKRNELA